jgi:flagellar basal body-associated protein FliL
MPVSTTLIAVLISIFLAVGGTAVYFIYHSGEQKCEVQQAQVVTKTITNTVVKYEKIDAKTPYGASKSDAAKWLRGYTSGN